MALEKAKLKNISATPNTSIDVMFNPTEYSVSTNMNYADINVPGLKMPLVQFVRGDSRVLNVELYLDNSDVEESLEDKLAELRTFVQIDSDIHAPPVVRFEWGRGSQFDGVVTQFTETFQMFNDAGDIIRARVKLAIKSYEVAEVQYRDLNLASPDRTKTRVVKEGDRLDLIAMEEYGNPGEWRTIAKANGIPRPRLLRTGDVLIVPPL